MKIRSAGATHVGKVRSTNEDYLGGFDDLALYVVADGMGGHAAGEVASRMAVEIIHAVFHTALSDRTEPNTAPTAPGHRLVRAIEQANERIFSAGRDDPTLSGMGTTEGHRHAEALGGTDGDVGTELARGSQQQEGQQVGRHGNHRTGALCLRDHR